MVLKHNGKSRFIEDRGKEHLVCQTIYIFLKPETKHRPHNAVITEHLNNEKQVGKATPKIQTTERPYFQLTCHVISIVVVGLL
jgi:hypothetical protein